MYVFGKGYYIPQRQVFHTLSAQKFLPAAQRLSLIVEIVGVVVVGGHFSNFHCFAWKTLLESRTIGPFPFRCAAGNC